ncbi:MAG: hypothetical protein Q6373_015720 [Candidatus Sigynarchaeota archaeon]
MHKKNVLFDGGMSHSVIRMDVSKDICYIVSFKDKNGKIITVLGQVAEDAFDARRVGLPPFLMKNYTIFYEIISPLAIFATSYRDI